MFKNYLATFAFFLFAISARSQTLSEALKMLNYERYGSAKQMLEKITVREPSNAEAWYWLAQVYLQQPDRDLEKSRSVIESGSSKNRNNPLLEVARAQIGLLGKDPGGADQQLSQLYSANSKDLGVVKAIMRARLSAATRSSYSGLLGAALRSAYSKFEKLVKDAIAMGEAVSPKDGELFLLLGEAHQKLLGDGFSNSLQQYKAAEAYPESRARAYYLQGKIYMLLKNNEFAVEIFDKTIRTDPAFAPVYLLLFTMYKETGDAAKAKANFEKYLANADKECNNEFYLADFLNRFGKYQDGLNKANSLLGGECGNNPILQLIIASSQEGLGNNAGAREAIDKYMQIQKADELKPTDLAMAGRIYAAIPGQEKQAIRFYQQALDADTSELGKLGYILKMEPLVKKTGDAESLFSLAEKKYKLKSNPSNRDIYDYAQAAYSAGRYPLSESLFTQYIGKYPDQYYGYYGRGNARWMMDQDGKLGLAVADYEKFESLVIAEKEKYKSQLTKAYAYLAGHYANSGTNKAKAVGYIKKYLELDPGNAQMKSALEKLGGQ